MFVTLLGFCSVCVSAASEPQLESVSQATDRLAEALNSLQEPQQKIIADAGDWERTALQRRAALGLSHGELLATDAYVSGVVARSRWAAATLKRAVQAPRRSPAAMRSALRAAEVLLRASGSAGQRTADLSSAASGAHEVLRPVPGDLESRVAGGGGGGKEGHSGDGGGRGRGTAASGRAMVWPATLGGGPLTEEAMSQMVTTLDLAPLRHAAAATAAKRLQRKVEARTLAAFNPSIVHLPQWAKDRLGVPNGLLATSKVAGFHQCDLPVDSCPNLEGLPDRAWVSEMGWAVVSAKEVGPARGRQLRVSLRAAGVLSGAAWQDGVTVRRIARLDGPLRERTHIGGCMTEDPRLFFAPGVGDDAPSLWVSWVVAGRLANCPKVAWPLSQRTMLTPLTLRPAPGGQLDVVADANRTVQLIVPGLSQQCQNEKNMNFFSSKGVLWAEYQIEPHIVCRVNLATGWCTDVLVTSAGLLHGLRGTAGFVPIKYGGRDMFLGVGHVNEEPEDTSRNHTRPWRYRSFLYAFDARPPFRIRALSNNFCFPFERRHEYAGRSAGECPRQHAHQMVFGMVWQGDSLVLGIGEQDCASRVTMLPRDWIIQSLVPRPANSTRRLRVGKVLARKPEPEACRLLSGMRWKLDGDSPRGRDLSE
eukprot:TRINITY_DN6295_c0_g1_i2.p1 TRINITY_DN6295_c0_g1~~TRINITY_DN6295_c0_g1_i2.p1  ORF type:complete len:648 (+),score=72.41 TRINITY_DN6295_c0_g1_i2:42-1985(+)